MSYRNIIIILSALIVGIFCGWLIGARQEKQIVESIRYVQRPATNINFKLPAPSRVDSFDLPKLQYHDTTYIKERIPADTAGIINDYFKRRIYDLDFSTDTTGVYKLQLVTFCNRLESASATIIPLQREVEQTVVTVRKFRPFVSGGVAIGEKVAASLGAGAIVKEKHIVRLEYMRIGDKNYVQAGYGFVFGK